MALSIPIGYAQCAVEIRNDGDPAPWYVTHGVDSSDAGPDFVALGQRVLSSFDSAWGSYLATSSRITGVYLTFGGEDGNYTLYVTPDTELVGTSTAPKLPQNCAYLVQKVTGRPGRAGKGRVFLPGMAPEGSVSDVGVVSSTAVTNGQNTCDTWLELLASDAVLACPMVLLHNEGIPGGDAPNPVNALRFGSVIATQRRRLRR